MAANVHACTPQCPPVHREHLHHMTDGHWHDNCRYCIRRREKGGTGLEGEPASGQAGERVRTCECEQCDGPAVWAWQPPGMEDPVLLCDEDASGADLRHLRALDGLAGVDRG